MSATAREATAASIKTVKTGNCPSLSGKSKLTYEFGIDDQAAWHVRIAKNSSTGYFSKAWVAFEHVQRVLEKNGTRPITCHTLGPIFKGRSVNTSGFLLAALKAVGLVQTSADNPRTYELGDGAAFFAELQAWAAAAKTPSATTKKRKTANAKAPAV